MGDKRQKNQLQMMLAFTDEGRSEAPTARREETESPSTIMMPKAQPAQIDGWRKYVSEKT